ncbi:hypothetical protein GCM10010211_08270 [Streptomyces albospinus]|uniref:Ricin B lectin domain-containing protein n=1 Tax=Streptomyces albospinus TaxID=285515 RepID=A0ABQ2UNV7_9ACTN|nr:DUF3472 domain-containing protein [Streptomyces albospinus]GGU46914.1 hypothetical protein GCM10010211_08270 [Streptomyces albospinus]
MTKRPTRHRLLAGALSLGLAAGLGTLATSPAAAENGHTPGTYTNYSFPDGTSSLHDVSWTTTPAYDPGYASEIFWSHQFDFDNHRVGYIGMQSNGGSPRKLLFSAWDTTEAKPGSPGSSCEAFGGEGSGQHCSVPLDWRAGHTYRFQVAATGQGWFRATVTDTTSDTTTDLGSIKTTATGISPDNMVDWTEYFEWNDPRATCYDQPNSAAAFGLPKGDGGTVTASVASTETGTSCKAGAKVEVTEEGSVQRNAIDNTARGTLRNGHACLAVRAPGNHAETSLASCTVATDRAWVHAADRTLRLASNRCLSEENSAVLARDCAGAPGDGKVDDPAKLWAYDTALRTLKNKESGRCLTAAPDSIPATEPCTPGNAAQTWTIPTRDGARTPPEHPQPAALPRTGGDSSPLPLLLGGGIALIVGGTATALAIRRRRARTVRARD